MTKNITLPNGVSLQYVERGSTTGVPVVFLHGVTDSWRSFEHVLAELPPALRAFAITQRGHGESSRPAGGYRYADLAEDVNAFMDAVNLPAAVIVGHSMGASVAQQFATNHPTRVLRLVLMGAFATIQGSEDIQEFWDTTVSKLTDPIDRAVAREFQVSTLAHPIPDEQLDTFISESERVPARVWQALFRGFLETPALGRDLNRVKAPTLILWGDRDTYATRADQELLQTAIPGARLQIYEGNGHALHWEDPRRFVKDLVSFVGDSASFAPSEVPETNGPLQQA